MKIDDTTIDRWKKSARSFLMARGYFPEDIHDTGQVWHIAHVLDFSREAYAMNCNDRHIETALRRIFPNMNRSK